jgi:transposase
MLDRAALDPTRLAQMPAEELRVLMLQLLEANGRQEREITQRGLKIDKLTYEIAQLKRARFGVKSERLDTAQQALFEEAIDEDIAACEQQLAELTADKPDDADKGERRRPRREPLPGHLPRVERHHEPASTTCGCGCAMTRIGEDVAEKLDYQPGVFTVERHIRGKWACAHCKTLVQAPVVPAVIDKGIPTAGLVAQVMVAKHHDHLPLYRQEQVFARAGLAIPRSTLGAWMGQGGVRLVPLAEALRRHLLGCRVIHADETPVSVLAPGTGKTQRAYLWAYAAAETESIKAVVYDFCAGRSGAHAQVFLGHEPDAGEPGKRPWSGALVCDDYAGYKALFAAGVTEVGCMAHARRKLYELHASNRSHIAEQGLALIGQLYAVEAQIRAMPPAQRLQHRQGRSRPIAETLHRWLLAHRQKVTDGGATAKAIDYSLNRWAALTRYLDDPALPIDNNHDERQIRPWTTGRKNWLFAGTLAAGQRAAAITSLIQSAKLNGLDPYAYLKDVLERLPTQLNSRIDELLPHRWRPEPG